MLGIDLLIFDFDGTITDSIPSAVKAVQKMMAELGFPHKTAEEINKHVGYGEAPLISGSIGSNDPKLIDKAMKAYAEIYFKSGLKNITVYPHVKETLELLNDKIKVILSNKKDDFINKIMENTGLSKYFKEVMGGDTSPCLKPDPCAVVKIANKYKIPKEKILFVGDMAIDIQTGKNAGVLTCGVTYGFDGKEKVQKENPDYLIDDFGDLKNIIE